MFVAEAEVSWLLLDVDPLVVAEELPNVVDFLVVLVAEVLHVVDAVPVGLLSADCAVLDVGLGVLVERVDLDFGGHLVEEADLLAVMDAVGVAELAGGLLLVLEEHRVIVLWHWFSRLTFLVVSGHWLHEGSSYCHLE